ncbi:bL21 family ribosomal protein [Candidatus Vidania fulgoroideorum]
MIIIFEYKGFQHVIEKNSFIKVKNINFEGKIIIKKVIFFYDEEILIGNPYLNKTLEINSIFYKKEKGITAKFKKRKRYFRKKGFSNKVYKLSFLRIY